MMNLFNYSQPDNKEDLEDKISTNIIDFGLKSEKPKKNALNQVLNQIQLKLI